jgi:hypothetical protein
METIEEVSEPRLFSHSERITHKEKKKQSLVSSGLLETGNSIIGDERLQILSPNNRNLHFILSGCFYYFVNADTSTGIELFY